MRSPSNRIPSPLDHAVRLRTRDRIVALGDALRGSVSVDREAMALMLIELASRDTTPGSERLGGSHAAGPVELLARIPEKWRTRFADEALFELSRAWEHLPGGVRPLAVALGRDRWFEAVRTLAGHAEADARLAAIAIARDTADPGLGKVVASLLSDEEQRVRRAADDALLRMALKLLDHLPPELLGQSYAGIARSPSVPLPADPAVLALERCTLYEAISDAAWSFASHRCRSPLIAALLLMDRAISTPLEREAGARMRRLLSQRNHPSHAPIRSVLKRTDCPLLRERSLRWLKIGAISQAALDRLCVAESLTEHELLLTRSHLMLHPARAARMSSLGHARASTQQREMLPGRERWGALSESAKRGLLALSALIGERDGAGRARIEPALADDSPIVRLTASVLCSGLDLQDYLFDPDPRVARHAALRWSTVGIEPPRPDAPSGLARIKLGAQAVRSPHAFVRRAAQEELGRLSILDPGSPGARHQARRLLLSDPAGFARMVRDHLSDPSARNEAIMLIRVLGIEQRFELDLIGIAQDEQHNERARASAVAALGRIGSKAASYTLSEALSAKDPRTRSNAVETASLTDDRLLEFKDDAHHRVRASAVRRTLEHAIDEHAGELSRSACAALIEMLCDERGEHRLAGAWAAQRTLCARNRTALGINWSPLVARLEDLAANDEDPRLRERAGTCIQRLSRELQLRPRVESGAGTEERWN